MKKIIVVLICFVYLGCTGSGISIKPDIKLTDTLKTSAISTVGYLVAKNNTEYIPEILNWYTNFTEYNNLGDVQQEWQKGMTKLTKMTSKDPFLQMQIKNALDSLQINIAGPQVPNEIDDYQYIVESFMLGVMSVSY